MDKGEINMRDYTKTFNFKLSPLLKIAWLLYNNGNGIIDVRFSRIWTTRMPIIILVKESFEITGGDKFESGVITRIVSNMYNDPKLYQELTEDISCDCNVDVIDICKKIYSEYKSNLNKDSKLPFISLNNKINLIDEVIHENYRRKVATFNSISDMIKYYEDIGMELMMECGKVFIHQK